MPGGPDEPRDRIAGARTQASRGSDTWGHHPTHRWWDHCDAGAVPLPGAGAQRPVRDRVQRHLRGAGRPHPCGLRPYRGRHRGGPRHRGGHSAQRGRGGERRSRVRVHAAVSDAGMQHRRVRPVRGGLRSGGVRARAPTGHLRPRVPRRPVGGADRCRGGVVCRAGRGGG